MLRVFPILLVLFLTLLQCSKLPILKPENITAITDSLICSENISEVKGSGTIFIKVNGKKYFGSTDIRWIKNKSFHADFYSPFGSLISTIKSDTATVTAEFNGKAYSFKIDSLMDSLPFNCEGMGNFNIISQYATGNISSILPILKQKPDSIENQDKVANIFWIAKTINIYAAVKRSNAVIQKINIKGNSFPKQCEVAFSKFDHGIAHTILFKEDENNYFSIEYDHLEIKEQ